MRILTVCSCYRVFGAENITLKMIQGFKQRGHDQVAVTSVWSDGEFSRCLTPLGVTEERLALGAVTKRLSLRHIWWMVNTAARLPGAWIRWARLLRSFRPDVVLFTGSRQALLLCPWLHRQPSVLIEFTNILPNAGNRWIYRVVGPKIRSFIAVSNFMSRHLVDLGAPAGKIRIVKSGTFFEKDKQAMQPAVASFTRTQDGPFRIGLVGQVSQSKGHGCLLEAVQLLRARGLNLLVQIFGSGEPRYLDQLKRRVAEDKLTDIWNWMGYERDKAKIFGSMDVCVVPSCFGDPFPTVAMEAGVYGLPVVASRIGGLPEIVEDGVTGWLIEPNSPAQLADRLEWLIKNPNGGRAMGAAGRVKVFEQFTVEKMVAELEALLEKFAGR